MGMMDVDEQTQQPKGMSLTLSDWLYQGIVTEGGVLAIHSDYFRLTGGLERYLYRIARKHGGKQPEGWRCTVKVLHAKTDSDSPAKKFAFMLRKVVQANELPEYNLSWI